MTMARIRRSMKRTSPDTRTDTRTFEPLQKLRIIHAVSNTFNTDEERRLWELEGYDMYGYQCARAQYIEAKQLGLIARRIYYTTGSIAETYATLAEMRHKMDMQCTVTTYGDGVPLITMPVIKFTDDKIVVRPSVVAVLSDTPSCE